MRLTAIGFERIIVATLFSIPASFANIATEDKYCLVDSQAIEEKKSVLLNEQLKHNVPSADDYETYFQETSLP